LRVGVAISLSSTGVGPREGRSPTSPRSACAGGSVAEGRGTSRRGAETRPAGDRV
jgi:hypothetical protein